MSYIYIQNLDMSGGDIQFVDVTTLEDALKMAPILIKEDQTKCVTIVEVSANLYTLCYKNTRLTNPAPSKEHQRCTSVFYGHPIK